MTTPATAEGYEDAIALAERLLDEGRFDEAWAVCSTAVDSPSDDGRALHIAGIVEMRRGDTERAVETLKKAARQRSLDPAVHNSLGETLRLSGQLDTAEVHLRFAVHLDLSLIHI